MSELLYKDVSVSNPFGKSYAIMGACFNVYKTMGCGFLESVYQECLVRQLADEYQGIPYSQKNISISGFSFPLSFKHVLL